MKKKYKYGTLVSNVGNVFPTITELEELEDNEWYLQIKTYFNDVAELNYSKRTINRKVELNDFTTLLLFVQKKIRLKLLTNIYKYSRLYETTVLEYNPLWNVDGVEERTITREKDGSVTDTYNETTANRKTGSDGHSKTGTDSNAMTGTDTTTESKTTFDSSSFYETGKEVNSPLTTNTATYNSTNTDTYNSTDTATHTGTKGNVTGEEEETHEVLERHGNIGVTKSTELIDSQRLTVDFSYIEYVVHDLINDFTILVD